MSITTEDIAQCVQILEGLVEDRGALADVDTETRIRLLTAAGRVSRPERTDQRRLSREVIKKKKLALRAKDEHQLERTGIRQKRQKAELTGPEPLALSASEGGLFDVYLDGKSMGTLDSYNVDGERYREGLWGKFDLAPGEHIEAGSEVLHASQVVGGHHHRPAAAGDFPELPVPALPGTAEPYSVLVTGIGGTGVVTIGQILAMAGPGEMRRRIAPRHLGQLRPVADHQLAARQVEGEEVLDALLDRHAPVRGRRRPTVDGVGSRVRRDAPQFRSRAVDGMCCLMSS